MTVIALFFGLKSCSTSEALSEQHSLLTAIQDSSHFYKEKLGREVIEKKAAIASLVTLNASYRLLSKNQKHLADNINTLPKQENKNLTAATEIKQVIQFKNIMEVDSTHHWQSHSDTLNYAIRTAGDTLRIDSLSIPNQLFITQQKAKNGAIVITARNSNPLIKNQAIDSIVIPQKKPSKLVNTILFLAGLAGGYYISR